MDGCWNMNVNEWMEIMTWECMHTYVRSVHISNTEKPQLSFIVAESASTCNNGKHPTWAQPSEIGKEKFGGMMETFDQQSDVNPAMIQQEIWWRIKRSTVAYCSPQHF